MNPPSQTDYALGHPLSLLIGFFVSFSLLGRFCIDVETHQSPSLLMLIAALLLARRMGDARKRLAAHNNWRREWQEMSGEAPRRSAVRPGTYRSLIGALVWLLLLAWQAGDEPATQPAHGIVSVALWGLTFWGLYGIGRQFLRLVAWAVRPSSPTRLRPTSHHVVAICVAKPMSSPSPKDFTRALPEYCLALLEAGNEQLAS